MQLSSDGKMVVIHDKTLDRTTDCTGYVKDQTLAYINACNTEPAGPHPPSSSGRHWYLKATDLKIRNSKAPGPRQVETFVDEIALQGLTARTIAASFSTTNLTHAKTHARQ